MATSSGNFTMSLRDSERIQRHYDYFLERVFNPGDLITTLFSKGVLDLDRKTRILNTETGRPRVEKLLDILMTECGDCYQIFIEALREKGFGPIADTLGEQTPRNIRLVLLGKTGVGKSHLGNLLLNKDYFKCSNSLHSCTSVCSSGQRALDEDTILDIMDTPGIFDTRDNNTETVKKFLSIFKCTGIHIFLMVVRIDVRFTEEDESALRSLCDVFGEDINDHLIVVMNNQSQKIKSKENLLSELPTSLKDILDRCEHRCIVVNYVTDVTVDGKEEIEAIINTIQSNVIKNKGRSYTHRMYKEAEKAYSATLKRQKNDLEKTIQRLNRENNELKKTLVQQNPLPKPEREKNKYQTDAENLLHDATSKQFVVTRAFEEGRRILEQHFILGIIGAVGDGKTVLCRMIADSFLKVHKHFIPLEIGQPRDMDSITFTDEDSYLLIIDDMFGIWTRTIKQQIQEWPKHFELLYLGKQKGKSAVIYVMRNDVYQACNHLLRKYEIFSTLYQLQLHETQFQLSKNEKKEILRYHFRNRCDDQLEKMLEHSSGCFGFPGIVSLCSKTWTGKAIWILNGLFEFLRREYDIFWNEDRIKYMALFVIFSPQPISVDGIRQKMNHLRQNQIQQDMGNPGGVEDVLDTCSHLTGSYVICDEDNRMSLPEKVIRCFLLHVSQRFIKLTIKYCPFDLLIDHVSTVPGDQKVFIQPRFYVDLYERFYRELQESNKAVLYHQAFLDSNFLQTVLNVDSAEMLLNPELKVQLGGDPMDEGHFMHYVCLFGYLKELQIVFSYSSKTASILSDIKTKLGLDLLILAVKSENEPKDKIKYLRDQKCVMERQSKADIHQLIQAAVQSSSLDTLKYVSFFTDFDINSVDFNHRTCLHYACDSNYDIPEIAKYLVTKGANIDAKDQNGCTPLVLALQRGKALTIDCLLKLNSSVNVADKDEKLPIHVAANSNAGRLDIDTPGIIEQLVDAGSPVNAKDVCGRTPLIEARAKFDEKTIEVLIKKGAVEHIPGQTLTVEELSIYEIHLTDEQLSIDVPFSTDHKLSTRDHKDHVETKNQTEDSSMEFPLHHSAYSDDIHKFIPILDQYKESINVVDNDGKTPIEIACFSEFDIVHKIKLLVSTGYTSCKTLVYICQSAPIDLLKLIFDKTLYDTMNKRDQTRILEIRKRLLQDRGLDILDTYKQTLFYCACRYSTLTAVQYLIDNNCNVNCVGGKYNRTPVFYCCFKDVPQAVEKMQVLVSNGANLDFTDIDNTSLLHVACALSTVDVVQYLIDNNCNVNCVGGKYNRTPVFYCCDTGVPQAVEKMKVLVCNGANLDVTDINNESALHRACELSTVDVVEYLADNNCNVNCVNKYNSTPVCYCCFKYVPQAVEKMKVLASNGANLDFTDIDNTSLLHVACTLGTVDVVEYLADNNCNVNCVGGDYNLTPVIYCCFEDVPQAVEKIKVLVSNGANLDGTDIDNTSLLHVACKLSTVDVVEYLVDNNCNVNCVDKYNRTPVCNCCFKDVPQAVEKMKVLASNGANLDGTDINNESALHEACALSTVDVVQYLADNNCNVNCVGGEYNRTPVFYCCFKDVPQAVEKMKVLVSNGANLDFTDIDNTSLLHVACTLSTVDVVQYLVDNNCNVNCVGGKYNRTPVFYCCYKDVPQAVEKMKVLASNGANLDVTDIDITSLLHLACALSTVDVVQYLIDNGCDVNCVDKYNRTPVCSCCGEDVPQAVEKMKVLVSDGANLDVTGIDNTPLLHVACALSTVDVIQYLIDNGCNVNCVGGKYNITPVMFCFEDLPEAVGKVKVLASNGANLDGTDINNASHLHLACALSTVDVVQYLIDSGCNVNCVDGEYNTTPVFYCCRRGVPQAVEKMKVLVSNGANLDFTDIDNTSLLHVACALSTVDVVQYLVDNNCNVNCVGGKYNRTPVFYCCYKDVPQAVEKMQVLVSNGANLDGTDINNESALHAACALSTVDVVQYLADNKYWNVNHVGGEYNRTPVFYCCFKDVPQAVEKINVLVSNGARLDSVDAQNSTLLHLACELSTVEVVEYLIDRNCNVNYIGGRHNSTSVFYSCCVSETQRIDKIKLLLSRGAKLNRGQKLNCIEIAKSLGYYDTVQFVDKIPV